MLTAALFIGNVAALAATVLKDRKRHRSRGKLAAEPAAHAIDARRVRARLRDEVETLRATRKGWAVRAVRLVFRPRDPDDELRFR